MTENIELKERADTPEVDIAEGIKSSFSCFENLLMQQINRSLDKFKGDMEMRLGEVETSLLEAGSVTEQKDAQAKHDIQAIRDDMQKKLKEADERLTLYAKESIHLMNSILLKE